ncbi:MAG: hypothetical protein E3J41_01740 [Candidatus Cloacimonadota bacterium]|nr:MAG: hypothetical protein E3J41_01740 [Candidatus Cloacimonadota bacterium]
MKSESIVKIPLNPPFLKGDFSGGYVLEKGEPNSIPPFEKGGLGGINCDKPEKLDNFLTKCGL